MTVKKDRIRFGILLFLFCVATIIFTLCLPLKGYAQESSENVVRVGYYPMADYQETDANGNHSGFGYDYYMQIAKYTKWDYEFVEASYSECYQMLLNGEIDVMSGLSKTAAREEQMLFAETSVSNMQNRLYARNDADLFYGDFERFDGLKVAVMKGTLITELEEYASTHDFHIEMEEYDTTVEMQDALLNHEVDLLYSASVSDNVNTKIVARLRKQPLYFAITKDKTEIAKEMETALEQIIDNNPTFSVQMSEKYQISGANATATFTREESAYLESGRKAYIIINTDWAPISSYDSKTKEYKGIVVDVMAEIKKYSNLNYELCTEAEFNQLVTKNPALINDVIAFLADDNNWATRQDVVMSNHIMDTPVVMVAKRSTHQTELNENSKIALPSDYYITELLKEEFSEEQIIYYDTIQECMDALNKGEAEITFVNQVVATYYLSNLEYSNLFATAHSGYSENIAFAIYKDTDAPLLGIIDKALMCIGAEDLQEIVIKNSIVDQQITLKGIYYSNPSLVIFSIIIVMAFLGGGIFTIYHISAKRQKMNKELEQEQKTINARTEFFMMISHELRTPLNAIVGYLNFLEDECKKYGLNLEYLKRSKAAASQLTAISEDMLDYSQIASDKAVLKEELFDLKSVVHAVKEIIELAAAQKGIAFDFTVDNINHEFIIGDKLRIAQIMQNLLSNAVKFTAEGGSVFAEVRQTELQDGSLELHFIARDTGKGMSKDFMQIVCAPFQQGDKAYSRTHGGLGLGLYLTKYYINAMNGQMDVSSVIGEGSTFAVTIPLKKAHSEMVLESSTVDFSHIRAIVAGTDEDANEKICELLKRLKIKSDAVTEPNKLVRRIESRIGGNYEYALCILDETLLDEKLSVIEEMNRLEKVPFVFVMTNTADRITELSANNLIKNVLYKPIFQSSLFDAIMNTFGSYEEEKKASESKNFGGITALIAEDNKVNADILKRMLEKANVNSIICENGQIAVDTFENAQADTFKIVFMDIQMPVMDGLEAAKLIRNSLSPDGKTIPIVAVSANAFQSDVEKSLQAGMNDHISKPVNCSVLYKAIETLVTF